MTDSFDALELRDAGEREAALMRALPAQIAAAQATTAYAEILRGVNAAAVTSRSALAKLPVGQWTTLGVPLKCLAAAGADVTKLDRVLSLESDGQLQLSLSKVALGALNEAANVLDCPTQ